MTPDPYTNSGRLNDPQSWNRYAYTRGDPVNRIDPTGNEDGPPIFSVTVVASTYDYTYPISSSYNYGSYYSAQGAAAAQAAIQQYQSSNINAAISAVGAVNWAYFSNVVSLALQALGSPDCAAVYNTKGSSSYTPQMVLQSMLPGAWPSGYWFGTISFAPIDKAYSAQTNIGGMVQGYGWTVANIEINTGSTGDFFNGNVVNSVDTLFHELGHAFGFLTALGGSKIVNDVNADGSVNEDAEAANEAALAPCRTAVEALLK